MAILLANIFFMINEILPRVVKLLYLFIPLNILRNKISNFNISKAYQIVKKIEKAKNEKISIKKIKTILFFSGINLMLKNNEFYKKLLDLITNDGDMKANRAYLKNQLQNKKLNSVGYRTWLQLRDLFYLKSEMVLGGVCRKNALHCAAKSKLGLFLGSKNKARARLELSLNSCNIAKYLKSHPLEYNFDKTILNKFISIVHNIKFDLKNYKNTDDNEKFFKIFNNKTVAIVGPSQTNNNNAAEIDSFDIVVRLNYSYTGKNLDNFNKGFKTDVSYFNGEQIDYLISSEDYKLPQEIKLVCIKDNGTHRKKKLQKSNPNKIIRKITNFNSLNFYSSFNLLPLAVLDILQTNVKIIKIFHSDLFLSKIRVANYYPYTFNHNEDMRILRQKESFLDHDPTMHHKLFQKLYKIKKITGDDEFNKVMKLDTYKYLKKLEHIYR